MTGIFLCARGSEDPPYLSSLEAKHSMSHCITEAEQYQHYVAPIYHFPGFDTPVIFALTNTQHEVIICVPPCRTEERSQTPNDW